MSAGTSSANERDIERQAMVSTLAGAFDIGWFRWLRSVFLHAAAVPSIALWIHSRWPLPELAAWFAAFGWASCAGLAVLSGAAAWRAQARFECDGPKSASIATVTLAPSDPLSRLSESLASVAVAASSVLWLNAVAPGLVSSDLLAFGRVVWPVLAGLALAFLMKSLCDGGFS
jgi:hypothetical protein